MCKKFVVIRDVWHCGTIGIAKSIPIAINNLIKQNYLNNLTSLQIKDYPSIKDYYGKNWKDILNHMTTNDLNIIFEDYLSFKWVELWEE